MVLERSRMAQEARVPTTIGPPKASSVNECHVSGEICGIDRHDKHLSAHVRIQQGQGSFMVEIHVDYTVCDTRHLRVHDVILVRGRLAQHVFQDRRWAVHRKYIIVADTVTHVVRSRVPDH
jgi:hypothetical protein